MTPSYADPLQKRRLTTLPLAQDQAHSPLHLSTHTVQRAALDPQRLTPIDIAALQHTVGNSTVATMLHSKGESISAPGVRPSIQRKLHVGAADDRYEREADKVAQSVQGSSRQPTSRQPSQPQNSIQRDPVGPAGGPVQGNVESRLQQTQGSGRSLPDAVRNQLEPKLGADLSQVKVHTNKESVQLTQEMGAKAFTHKNHIYYGEGYSPNDLQLTAHETVHTIQQGAVSQTAQRLPADNVSQSTKPLISRVSAHIQRWFWDKSKRKKKNMSDQDVVSQTMGEGGTANRVDKILYNRNIGKSKQRLGFFKPNTIEDKGFNTEKEQVEMANRAVASSRLDKWLGTNVLAEEVWARHKGENGSVSAAVPGSPLYENQFETQMPEDFDIDLELDPTQFKNKDGRYYKNSGQHFNHHDFSNPTTQKGLSDLQLLDAITGQSDRHGGNIYIDDKTGKVKGIDNDIAFGKGETSVDVLNGKYHGLPSQVDKRTANKILKKKAKNLPKVLGSKYGGKLTDEEIQEAQTRLREVKRYLKGLKKNKKLVKKWDDTTYLRSQNETDRRDKWGKSDMEPSYAKRSINQYVEAEDRDTGDEFTTHMFNNPLFEEELVN